MPLEEQSIVSQRRELVTLLQQPGANRRELCRRYNVSPTTGYELLRRYEAEGLDGLEDRSRRPHCSPGRTSDAVESAVLKLRQQHPSWGGRKLRRRLQDCGLSGVPSASTITEILRRHGLLEGADQAGRPAIQRFERALPNELWQMDFKGHFAAGETRCHPLTVLDDHSRYSLAIEACADEQGVTVRQRLTRTFQRYGLPEAMLMDNGSPWGGDDEHPHTPLTVWLLHLGVAVKHGRPYHPQTQGKDERFHRTLKAEAIGRQAFRDLDHCQSAFNDWREVYNFERPHEALGMTTPATRYRASARSFPEKLPDIEYAPDLAVRKVQQGGWISFRNRAIRVGKSFRGQPVALRPTLEDGCYDVLFAQHLVAQIDLRELPDA